MFLSGALVKDKLLHSEGWPWSLDARDSDPECCNCMSTSTHCLQFLFPNRILPWPSARVKQILTRREQSYSCSRCCDRKPSKFNVGRVDFGSKSEGTEHHGGEGLAAGAGVCWSRGRERRPVLLDALFIQLSSFQPVKGLRLWNGPIHIQGGSSPCIH